MNKERFEELKALSVYGLAHVIRDHDDTPGAVDAVATDYRDMVAEIERLKNAIEFIYSYADGEFNGADGSDMYAHRRDLYTITQLCITALDGEPLTDDLIVKDEPAAAPVAEQWTPKDGETILCPDDNVTGVIRRYNGNSMLWAVTWADDETGVYKLEEVRRDFRPHPTK